MVVQRVSSASVIVDENIISSIGAGFVVFIGIFRGDHKKDLDLLVQKTVGLRIFNDKAGKMNLSIKEIKGEALVVSQFTLCADTTRGNRPSFINSENSYKAEYLYNQYCKNLENEGLFVSRGQFGANMKVKIQNDGPVTIILDTKLVYNEEVV